MSEPRDVGGGSPPRLKTRPEFLAVAKGRRQHAVGFTLQARARGDAGGPARVGFTVTKKAGGSVERNRMRRRLRAAAATPGLPLEPGHDYVIVARREVLGLPFGQVCADLAKTLRRLAGPAHERAGGKRRGLENPAAHETGPRC